MLSHLRYKLLASAGFCGREYPPIGDQEIDRVDFALERSCACSGSGVVTIYCSLHQLSRPLVLVRKAVVARRVTTLLYKSC